MFCIFLDMCIILIFDNMWQYPHLLSTYKTFLNNHYTILIFTVLLNIINKEHRQITQYKINQHKDPALSLKSWSHHSNIYRMTSSFIVVKFFMIYIIIHITLVFVSNALCNHLHDYNTLICSSFCHHPHPHRSAIFMTSTKISHSNTCFPLWYIPHL